MLRAMQRRNIPIALLFGFGANIAAQLVEVVLGLAIPWLFTDPPPYIAMRLDQWFGYGDGFAIGHAAQSILRDAILLALVVLGASGDTTPDPDRARTGFQGAGNALMLRVIA